MWKLKKNLGQPMSKGVLFFVVFCGILSMGICYSATKNILNFITDRKVSAEVVEEIRIPYNYIRVIDNCITIYEKRGFITVKRNFFFKKELIITEYYGTEILRHSIAISDYASIFIEQLPTIDYKSKSFEKFDNQYKFPMN